MQNASELFDQINARLYNYDLEKQILGHIINSEEDQVELLTNLRREHFNSTENGDLFDLIQGMFQTNHTISPVSVNTFIDLQVKDSHVKRIRKEFESIKNEKLTDSLFNSLSVLRELLKNRKIYSEILTKGSEMFCSNRPTDEIVEHIGSVLISIETGRAEPKTDDVTGDVVDEILGNKPVTKGLEIGLKDFDLQFGGVKKDRYYGIGAASGSGKTAILVDFIHRLCERHADKIKILFFSMEMSENRIVRRLISRATDLTDQQLEGRMKILNDQQRDDVAKAGKMVKGYPLEIVYQTMTTNQMRMRARKFALQNPGKHLIIMLDHIGLVNGATNDMRVNTILASSTMKSFAVDYKASVFVLTQFTKDSESNEARKYFYRPHMGYIMESGRIRQDADVILLGWRPEVWFQSIPYNGNPEWPTDGKYIMLNEKNRDGHAPNDIVLSAKVSTNKFEDSNETF